MNKIRKNLVYSIIILVFFTGVFIFGLIDIQTNWIALAFGIPFMAGMLVYIYYLIKEKSKLHDENIRRKLR